MSWSFQAVGKPEAVAREARAEKNRNACPISFEEGLRQQALEMLASSAEVQGPNVLVKGYANGSMWVHNEVVIQNNLEVKVEPLYGLVE